MLKKMLGSTAFERDSSKLPRAGFVTVTKLGCRAIKEEVVSCKTERLNLCSNARPEKLHPLRNHKSFWMLS
jgi:hypothetical protein